MHEFINKNIGRKLTFLIVPIICVIMAVTIILINHMYTKRFIETTEEGTHYITDTFKLNMDFCISDVKSFLNSLSSNDNVKVLVTMDEDSTDYAKRLGAEREMKKLISDLTSMKSYVQDVFVVGENGYQYNYLSALQGTLMETEWFKNSVYKDRKGFQYILPHDADYYEVGRKPASQAISILLPIKSDGITAGYVICDIRMDKAAVLPERMNNNANMKAYLLNGSTGNYYDFQSKTGYSENEAGFTKFIGEKDSDFLIADHDFIVYSKMESGDWYIVAVYLYKDIIASAVAAQRIGIIMLIVGCCMIIVVAHVISGFIRRPINEIIERMNRVEQQDFRPMEIEMSQNQPGEIVLIRNRFEEMIRQINELVHKVYLQEIYQKNMEYENLVNQVNPHFIYNVLQLIQAKAVKSENYEIDDIVVALSRLMRYTMSNKEKIVAVKEECSYIESYLELYEQRYSHKFSYEINMEKELEFYPVLKFIMQPVVENCIKHGFKNLKGEGIVKISIFREDDKACFLVEDNGKGMTAKRLAKLKEHMEDMEERQFDSIGLKNTYQRLKLTYGEEAGMWIESAQNEYTRVCLFIPYEEDKNVQDYVC